MKFAPNAWRAHNAMLEAAIKRYAPIHHPDDRIRISS